MLINIKRVKSVYHDQNKRISREALELLNVKVMALINKSIYASNGHMTIKACDLAHYSIRLEI